MGIHKARRAKVRQLCSEAGVIRPSDTAEVGSSPAQLRAMHKRGELKRVGHGLYVNASAQLSEMDIDLAKLQRRSSGVFISSLAPEVVLSTEEIQAYVDDFSDRATKVSHRQNRACAPVKIGEAKPASAL